MDFKHLCLLVPSEKDFEAEWRDAKGEWKTAEIRREIQNVKNSHFQIDFPRGDEPLGLRFVGRKVIHVSPRSLAARCGIKPNIHFVKINGLSVPNKTSAVNAMLRMALKKQELLVTFRPQTRREAARDEPSGDGPRSFSAPQPSCQGRVSQVEISAEEHKKLKNEVKDLRRRIDTEMKLRENEQQQAEIWKQLLNSQIEELERARDVSNAQLKLALEKGSKAKDMSAKFEEERDSLKNLLKETRGELDSTKMRLEEKEKEIKSLESKENTWKEKNAQLEEAVKVQKEQLKDITQMFNNGQQLMLAAHEKIEELEAQLKKNNEGEMKKVLERKEDEIARLKKRVDDLVNYTGGVRSPQKTSLNEGNEDLDFKSLYNEVSTDGIHGIVVLLVSHCTGLVEKSHQSRLRHLFAALGYRCEEIDGAMNPELRKSLTTRSGITTYPQVFVRSGEGEDAGYVFIGDFEKVFEMNEVGKIHQIFRGCALKDEERV